MAPQQDRSGRRTGFVVIGAGAALVLAVVLGIVFMVRAGAAVKAESRDACLAAAQDELGGMVAASYDGKPGDSRWQWTVGNGQASRTCLATLDDGAWSTSLLSDVG